MCEREKERERERERERNIERERKEAQTVSWVQEPLTCTRRSLYIYRKGASHPQKSPIHVPKKHYISAIELYTSAKNPHMSTKEPYTSAKEP